MGIPKFYRYTSERYPCLSERIREYQIPEFDNLYLDMNGIIHNCSHPNDEDIHLRIPEKQIFKDIFHYIDFLFKMIKPCKVFFMAVDGVAPRAKMNQQRGRRFRSAKLAEDQEAEAIRKGEVLPNEERFDSNCITPGTEFMARLHEQLKYFVQVKMTTDPLWQRPGLTVYLSGHDVPGEGEHKIMDFIRHIRSRPDYVPVRHCLYGLDADLVMLGLSTHELQFSLLREEVKFSRPKKNKKGMKKPPQKQTSAFDISSVDVFKAGCSNAISTDIKPNPETAMVELGRSFVDALGTVPIPTMQIVPSVFQPAQDKKADEEELIPPPPPDDSKAKGVYRAPLPEKTTFLLLHLSLMRDYIDFEFQELQEKLKGHPSLKYDLEKVLDDWILMNILVGNDFVPHLPHFHIVKGALPLLYQVYTEVLPTLDGYINESGMLNLSRFEVFIQRLSQFDLDTFRDTYDDMKYMESKTGKNIVLGEKMFENFDFGGANFEEEALEPMSPELKALAQRTEEELFGGKKEELGKTCNEVFAAHDDFFEPEDSPEFRLEFHQHKRNYYIDKLHLKEITPELLEHFCKEYVRAIQWVLLYYYKGVSSWGWFYPFHYAPFCSDLKNFANFDITFDLGNPFRPFEQLLGVLPSQSKKLLPQCYQWLMTEPNSPIVEFYPEKFEQDLNGKKQDWEAVVLIPFIDETKLLTVMKNEENKLNTEEIHRNSRGTMMVYSYTAEDTGPVSSAANLFPTLMSSHVKVDEIIDVTYSEETLPRGLHPKAKKEDIYQGFPTLKTKPIKALIDKAEIKVFEFVTREESMILSLEDIPDDSAPLQVLTRKIMGKSIWVNWPHLTYAFVTAILTRSGKWYMDASGRVYKDKDLVESRAEKEFRSVADGLVQRHLKCKGIRLGELHVIVYAKMMEGRKVRCESSGDVTFEILWSKLQQPFPLKTCMYEEKVTEIFYLDRTLASTYLDLFKIGDQVIHLGDKMFGTLGTVVGHNVSKKTVRVNFITTEVSGYEPNLSESVGRHDLKSNDYFSAHVAAGKCQISAYVLSRITGTVYISIEKETRAQQRMLAKKDAMEKRLAASDRSPTDHCSSSEDDEEDFPALQMKKINVGLDLKFNKKNLEVRGYTSKRDGMWYYSSKAIELVNEYVYKFSDFVGFLNRSDRGRDVFDASEIYRDKPLEKINEMEEWLDNRGVRDLPRISTNTNLLDDDDIDAVWKYVLKQNETKKKATVKELEVLPNLLLKPGLDRGCIPPIPNSTYNILDRVICIDRGAPIAVGGKGTIVGMQVPQASEPEQIEESFKSTGAATLMTLIVLSDPQPDVFDNPETFESTPKAKELTNSLASMLNLSRKTFDSKEADNLELGNTMKPRLIRLYPYQVLNISEGPTALRDAHMDSRQLKNLPGFQIQTNEQFQRPKMNMKQRDVATKEERTFTRILQRTAVPSAPIASLSNLSTGSKGKVVSQNGGQLQSLFSSIISRDTREAQHSELAWPPRPREQTSQSHVDTAEPFSTAAFLQKQFNAAPVPRQRNGPVLSEMHTQNHLNTRPNPPTTTILPQPNFSPQLLTRNSNGKSVTVQTKQTLPSSSNAHVRERNQGEPQELPNPAVKPPPPPAKWLNVNAPEFVPRNVPTQQQTLNNYVQPQPQFDPINTILYQPCT